MDVGGHVFLLAEVMFVVVFSGGAVLRPDPEGPVGQVLFEAVGALPGLEVVFAPVGVDGAGIGAFPVASRDIQELGHGLAAVAVVNVPLHGLVAAEELDEAVGVTGGFGIGCCEGVAGGGVVGGDAHGVLLGCEVVVVLYIII